MLVHCSAFFPKVIDKVDNISSLPLNWLSQFSPLYSTPKIPNSIGDVFFAFGITCMAHVRTLYANLCKLNIGH